MAEADGVLVGEGPGRDEAEQGRPFVGATGRALDEELLRAGLLRERLRIVNATCCQPKLPKKEKEMAQAVRCCAPAFKAQLKCTKGKPLLAMGKWAAAALTKKDKGVLNARGFIRWDFRRGPLIITYHPTFAIFRNPYEHGAFRCDLARFGRVIKGTTEPLPKKLIIEPTVSDVVSMFTNHPFVACDIETRPDHPSRPWTGLDPTRARIKAIGLGFTNWALAVDCTRNHVKVKDEIRKGLKDPRKVKVGHNFAWYDRRVLKRYGFECNNVEDTRDLRRALSATSPLSLRYVASLYLDYFPWKESDEDDSKGIVFSEDMKKLLTYCAHDCAVTARIYKKMKLEMDSAQ